MKVEGVSGVVTDEEKHLVTVSFDDTKTGPPQIAKALAEGKYPTEGEGRFVASPPVQTATAQPKPAEPMITGRLGMSQLFREYPVFEQGYRNYSPQSDVIESIRRIDKNIEILMFLGTWCKDSISEAPKILKILDAAKNEKLALSLYGVDRTKKEGSGLCEKYNVERVPTTIFLQNGKELGRIVEYPKKSPEQEVLEIISRP
jgi:thiol-disulfide isomerase/thioredoxin